MNSYSNIERCCQLHEKITIIYVVDGYQAHLTTGDSNELEVIEVWSESLDQLLLKLDIALKDKTLIDIRTKVRK